MPRGKYPRTIRTLAERLARRTTRTPSGCLVWNGARSPMGHGAIHTTVEPKRLLQAHRVAWELAFGPIPVGLCVLHKCDNPPCVNPVHLFLGTRSDNSADKVAKGRVPYGTALPQAKLTPKLVRAIRASRLSQSALSAKYGVSQATISNVRNRKVWQHVP